MMLHWPSFLIGMAFPLGIVAVLFAVSRARSSLRSERRSWSGKKGNAPSFGPEPLRFTPRLIGKLKLRQPLEHEDHAQAS